MRGTTTAALAIVALALCVPAGAADRGGFLVGLTLGVNLTSECGEGCEVVGGPTFGLHAGATVRPGLAVLGEFSVYGLSDGGDATAGVTDLIGAVQYYPVHWLWLGAGAGISNTGSSAASTTGPIVVGQAGIDFRGRKRFGIDLRGRYERRVDQGHEDRSVVVSVGFVLY